jgi:hypothetical protein
MHPTRRRRERKRIRVPPHERGRHQSMADILASAWHKWQKDTSTTSFSSHDARIEDCQVRGGSDQLPHFETRQSKCSPAARGCTHVRIWQLERLSGSPAVRGCTLHMIELQNPRARLPGAPGMDPVGAACSGICSKVPLRRYVGTFRRIKSRRLRSIPR